MYGQFIAFWVAATAFAGVVAYGVARRYGWTAALVLLLLALAAVIGMLWQAEGVGFREGLGITASALVFAAPTLAGALAGIAIAVWRK